ncbi:Protein FREE1 [Vitis vinifera]|uniref:Protein FREE1 n=1 Tax=Vitis vinifera TaxID=29760 RepID=A0A438E434_VITVI|nr:Protein FREE1 [Vitis vinifera]
MQQGDYNSVSYYQYQHPQNPNPNPIPNPNSIPIDPQPNPSPSTYASAPPFTTSYSPSDYSVYPAAYPPYPQNPEPVPNIPPTAPSYSPSPNLQSFNPSPQPSSFPPFEAQGSYQPPAQQPPYHPQYDQHLTAPNFSNPIPNSNANPSYANPPAYSASYSHVGSSVRPFTRTRMRLLQNLIKLADILMKLRVDMEPIAGHGSIRDDGYGDGVYAYEGSKVEPYGARGTAPKSSTWVGFDDYGRSISFPSGKDQQSAKIVRAVPKAETQQDVKSGVQKFRVKLLSEGGGQSSMDVLCQIGLDGIRMLEPSTSRTLRIYPLETITRCEVTDSSTFAFWSKSSVDIEPRRIRLQSNSYTTNTILDTVTAATVQIKEMGGRIRPSESLKTTEQPTEKKKGLLTG